MEPKKLVFSLDLAYPSDDTGIYQEVTGPIVKIGGYPGLRSVTISTEYGLIEGFVDKPMEKYVFKTKFARIRVYDSGGGFYPSNKVMSLNPTGY